MSRKIRPFRVAFAALVASTMSLHPVAWAFPRQFTPGGRMTPTTRGVVPQVPTARNTPLPVVVPRTVSTPRPTNLPVPVARASVPMVPRTPVVPVTPVKPVVPVKPIVPVIPVTPVTPVIPVIPVVPEVPDIRVDDDPRDIGKPWKPFEPELEPIELDGPRICGPDTSFEPKLTVRGLPVKGDPESEGPTAWRPLSLAFQFEIGDGPEDCIVPFSLLRIEYGLRVADGAGSEDDTDACDKIGDDIPLITGIFDNGGSQTEGSIIPPVSVEEPKGYRYFFRDSIDLYGKKGPGEIKVHPKIQLPDGVQILVDATLYYESDRNTVQGLTQITCPSGETIATDGAGDTLCRRGACQTALTGHTLAVAEAPGDVRYHRIRESFIRRIC